jgi:ankyrin repeat protein
MQLVHLPSTVDAESQTGAQGITPLYAASAQGQFEVVKLLLENGGDANSRGGANLSSMRTVIENLLSEASSMVVLSTQLLVGDIGISSNFSSKKEQTCAFLVGGRDRVSCTAGILTALQGGIDKFGTALHAACREDDLERVTMLLEHGADVNTQHEGQLV